MLDEVVPGGGDVQGPAEGVADRIVHHGRLIQFRNESYRVRHVLVQGGWPIEKACARLARRPLKSR